ncbi:MAG: serine/threonine-protein kinase [Pseudomonadota bacterium]
MQKDKREGHGGDDARETEVLTEVAGSPASIASDTETALEPRSVIRDREAAQDPGDSQAIPPAGERPQIIKDRFVLEEKLGKGGMGEVYRALDLRKKELRDDQPYVAIKFLGEAFSRHPQALISLQREAKKTQALAHPNIVTVYDFDRDGSQVYMTMELLEGDVLSDWLHARSKVAQQVDPGSIVIQLAEGLAYAHSKGFVHSDLKLENVFLTADGRVKILDFGIARIADEAVSTDSFDAGELGALTLRYASLEMLKRSAEPAPADDLYALGLMAYELYTGEHPFDGLPADKALAKQIKPRRPKSMTRHQWSAVERALRFHRRDRTSTAGEFLYVFRGLRRRRSFAVSAVLLLLVVSAFFAYMAQRETGPSVPFDELPAVVQAEFNDKLTKGNQSLAIGDLDGALRYFMESWQLHPRNPDAKAGLDEILGQLESRVEAAGTRREQEFLLAFFDAYADHPYFAGDSAFRGLHQRVRDALNESP